MSDSRITQLVDALRTTGRPGLLGVRPKSRDQRNDECYEAALLIEEQALALAALSVDVNFLSDQLNKIATLRPVGDLNTTRNARKILGEIEKIAWAAVERKGTA